MTVFVIQLLCLSALVAWGCAWRERALEAEAQRDRLARRAMPEGKQ